MWRSLERHLPENVRDKVHGMRFTKDRQVNNWSPLQLYLWCLTIKNSRKLFCYCSFLLFSRRNKFICLYIQGAAFDVPSELDAVITDRWTNGQYDTLEKATELPECEENMFDRRMSGGYSNNRFGQGYGGGGRKFGNGRMFSNSQRGSRGGFRGGFGGNKHKKF